MEDMNNPQRPALLSVLCVLTYIGSGLSAFGNFLAAGMKGYIGNMLESGELADQLSAMPLGEKLTETAIAGTEQFLAIPSVLWLAMGLLYIASIVGAAFMWQMKRSGFHIYTIAQCLVLILGIVVNRGAGFPYQSLIWTALFVGLYASTLKYMPAKDEFPAVELDGDGSDKADGDDLSNDGSDSEGSDN